MKQKIALLAAAALISAPVLSACSFSSDGAADPAFRTLRYEGGDFKGSKFKACLEEGEKLASNDKFYSYPNTQRQDKWDTRNYGQGAESADYPDMDLTDKNGVPVALRVTVPFLLNTSCEDVEVNGKVYKGGVIQVFHEVFGKTRNGYFDPTVDGNTSYGKGWLWLMDTYISTCAEQQLTPKVRENDAEAMWLDDSIRKGLGGAELQATIQECVNNAMETDLEFYIIGNPTVDAITPDKQFTDLYRARQEAQTRADTAELNKAAQIAEAQAKAAVAREEAKIKEAEISGYGGFDNYKCIYLADHGLNCAQPVYYVGGPGQP